MLPVIGGLVAALTNPGVGSYAGRFDLASFTALAERHGGTVAHDADQRNAIAVLPPLNAAGAALA